MSSPPSSNPDIDLHSLRAHYTLTPPLATVPVDGAGINNTTWLVRSGADYFVLKQYETFGEAATLRYEHELLGWLAHQRLPFAVPTPAALPVLLRQNEVVSTIWWLGRGLAAGNVAAQIGRIEHTRSLAGWLNKYEQTLVAALESASREAAR